MHTIRTLFSEIVAADLSHSMPTRVRKHNDHSWFFNASPKITVGRSVESGPDFSDLLYLGVNRWQGMHVYVGRYPMSDEEPTPRGTPHAPGAWGI
jgi:hypothetical protein